MQQENEDRQQFVQAPVSDIWRELLGSSSRKKEISLPDDEAAMPMLESDPWGELLQSRGIEIIDVQQLNLHISDQDVELALQVMQEDPLPDEGREP